MNLLRNLKLSMKIGGGFAVVLVLTAILGVVAYNSMGQVDRIVGVAQNANDIISEMKQARIHGTVYTRDTDDASARQTLEKVDAVIADAEAARDRLSSKADREEFAAVATAATEYRGEFERYTQLVGEQAQAVQGMIVARESLSKVIVEFAQQQRKAFGAIEETFDAAVAEGRAHVNRANQIGNALYRLRIAALYYLWQKDAKHLGTLDQELATIREHCDTLDEELTDPADRRLIETIRTAGTAYRNLLEQSVNTPDAAAQEEILVKVRAEAAKVVESSAALAESQEAQLVALDDRKDQQVRDGQAILTVAESILRDMEHIRGNVYRYMFDRKDASRDATIEAIEGVLAKAQGLTERM
ncbi:MAG: methyl-accepting chemotaxis protein, partial [Planctomycetota bacterium]